MHFYMLHIFLLLGIFLSVKCEHQKYANNSIQARSHDAIYDYTDYPYIATLLNTGGSEVIGHGVAVHLNYVLIRAEEGYKLTNKWSVIQIFLGLVDPYDLLSTDFGYTIRNVFIHPSYVSGDPSNNVALVKVCPDMTINLFVPIPNPVVTYTVGTEIALYFFESYDQLYEDLHIFIKDDSVCSDLSIYDNTEFYCAQTPSWNSAPSNSEVNLAPFILYQNKFYGFVMVRGSSQNYAIQKIDLFSGWINSYIV